MRIWRYSVPRSVIAFWHDVTMAALSFVVALGLRLGDEALPRLMDTLLWEMAMFTAVCAAVFWFTGLYRGVWRYASMNDLLSIVRSVTLALLLFLPLTFLVTRLDEFPRSWFLIDWFVLIFLLGAPRMVYRVFKDRGLDHLLERQSHVRIPVLLVGAGDAAELFIREMARDRGAAYEVLGVLDEKGTRVGRRIHDVSVLGSVEGLPGIIAQLGRNRRPPQRLIVTKDLDREVMVSLLDIAEANGMTIARLPRLTEFRSNVAEKLEIRPIAIEDLLSRSQACLDRNAMRELVQGRRILVTGAGGSIGSELVRQLADLKPSRVSLIDNSESLLYSIDLEVSEAHPDLTRRAILADVRDRRRIERVIVEEQPNLVFHAAAVKHVPMMEANPIEAICTNVIGTRNTADACRRAGVSVMILISTDKAINPTSVMGASKRLAESYCQALDLFELRQSKRSVTTSMRLITVRFGNVLGSTGSVVPLFQRQLAQGGPLTVTHPEMRRYFMTLREAVQLVLQASALGAEAPAHEVGKIYVLNMGNAIKIVDLAMQMIRLAGFRPGKDIEIVFTGPRAGEKLHEELFHGREEIDASRHPALLLASPRTASLELLRSQFDDLAKLAADGREDEALALLHRLVPEYSAGSYKEAEAVAAS